MNGRRGFMKTLVGAFVASAIEIRLATAPVLPAAPSVLTKAKIEEVYRMLTVATQEVWERRIRLHLSEGFKGS